MTAKINFTYTPLQPVEIPPLVWETAFFNYLINRKQFPIDLAAQETLLRTLADDIGLKGDQAPKMLEALNDRVKVWRRYQGLLKTPEALRLIEGELKSEGGKIVVLATSSNVLMEIRDGLAAYNSILIFPGTPDDKRRYVAKKFQTQKKYRVLVASVDAVGTALDLTVSSKVRVVEPHWFIDNNVQALMRVCNWRQEYDVDVRFYGLGGTLDEKIVRELARRTRARMADFVAPEQQTPGVVPIPPS